MWLEGSGEINEDQCLENVCWPCLIPFSGLLPLSVPLCSDGAGQRFWLGVGGSRRESSLEHDTHRVAVCSVSRLLMQTWQGGSPSFHIHKMHQGCGPNSLQGGSWWAHSGPRTRGGLVGVWGVSGGIREDEEEEGERCGDSGGGGWEGQAGEVGVFGVSQARVSAVWPLAPHTCTVVAQVWCWSSSQPPASSASSSSAAAAASPSAAVSGACLQPASSGVCRCEDAVSRTEGILAPRVEMRHFFHRHPAFLRNLLLCSSVLSQGGSAQTEQGFPPSSPALHLFILSLFFFSFLFVCDTTLPGRG